MINKAFIQNKILWFTASRYIGYVIQFVRGILLASLLGPALFGVWGILQIIIQYLSYANFGIPYSLNVELSILNNDQGKSSRITGNSFLITTLINSIVLIAACILFYADTGDLLNEEVRKYWLQILAITILTNYSALFTNLFRSYGKLLEVAFDELITIVLTTVILVIQVPGDLIAYMLNLWIISKVISLSFYIKRLFMGFRFRWDAPILKALVKKGSLLLIFNISIFLIPLSSRTIIGIFYSYHDIGLYTFAFNLANAVLLGMNAITYAIYPKVLNKLRNVDIEQYFFSMDNLLTKAILFLMLLITSFLPILFYFVESYYNSALLIIYMLVGQGLIASCFMYNTMLVAHNKQKYLSVIGMFTVAINIVLNFIAVVAKLEMEYIAFCSIISALIYKYLVSFIVKKHIKINFTEMLLQKRVLIPLILLLVLGFNRQFLLITAVLLLFVAMNYKNIKIHFLDLLKTNG